MSDNTPQSPPPAPGIEELNRLAKLLGEHLPPPNTETREAIVIYANALITAIRAALQPATPTGEANGHVE